jgi:cysteine/O-acetylserine efflux protein
MITNILSMIVFTFVSIFAPGPGNITCATMGLNYGFRDTLRFMAGNIIGYFVIMVLCSLLSISLLPIAPAVESVLRILGTAYILKLAYGTLHANYNPSKEKMSLLHFKQGFLIQTLNIQVIIIGLTLYTTFLSGLADHPVYLGLSTLALTLINFLSITLWTFSGAGIKKYLHNPYIRKGLNYVLTGLLLYCAVSISGVLHLF